MPNNLNDGYEFPWWGDGDYLHISAIFCDQHNTAT